jgi:NAD(P)H-nitrite reductase large subunit
MKPDDELCFCFHVTRRKVENFLRRELPRHVSELSECFGAGTGCGWCRPYLKKMFEAHRAHAEAALPEASEYAQGRGDYVRQGKGTPPPGATPIDDQQ